MSSLHSRHLTLVEPDEAGSDLHAFLAEYPSATTRRGYGNVLRRLLDAHPLATLTAGEAVQWCCPPGLANNTIRARLTVTLAFVEWTNAAGITAITTRPLARARRLYPKTYGKAQGIHPPRWLDHSQAFDTLVASCDDGTLLGLRDELVLRLGLSGMRVAEIAALRLGDLTGADTATPLITWTGKGNRPRKIEPSPSLLAAIHRYLRLYAAARPLDATLPLICVTSGGRHTRLAWGTGFSTGQHHSLWKLVQRRAHAAGLGHVSPHDLRRSAAGILHNAKSDTGGHHFDLLDIQRVLGHADPATTMRSYLDPIDNDVLSRAAQWLD